MDENTFYQKVSDLLKPHIQDSEVLEQLETDVTIIFSNELESWTIRHEELENALNSIKKTHSLFTEVIIERQRQDAKFGKQNHHPFEWMPILVEEVGEAAKEATDYYFRYADKTTTKKQPSFIDIQNKRLQRYRNEVIQVATVAIAMIESLDRGEFNERPLPF